MNLFRKNLAKLIVEFQIYDSQNETYRAMKFHQKFKLNDVLHSI